MMSNVAGLEGSPFRDSRYPLVLAGSIFPQSTTKGSVKEFQPLSVGQAGVTKQLERVAQQQGDADRKLVEPGDLVINSRSDRRGASGVSSLTGLVSVVYTVLKPRTEYIDPRYAALLFKSKAFQDEYYRWGTGIVDDLWSTRYERFASIRLPLPPLETQRRIADYLDKETAQIDTLVAELDDYVELLEKRRASQLGELLYKGESGENFPLVPLSLLVKVSDGLVDPLDEKYSDLPLIAPNHIEKNTGKLLSPIDSAKEQGAISGKGYVKAGQVVYSKIRPSLNKVAIANEDSLCSADMYPLEILGDVTEQFLLNALLDKRFVDSAVMESSRVAMPKVNRETLGILRIPLPSMDEQHRINSAVESETAQTDTLIKECRELKEILLKRRQVLITDVVTGKVEV